MRECKSARVRECESVSVKVRVREWFLSIDMKTKVVHHVQSEWMRECKFCRFARGCKFASFAGSQLLSFRHFFWGNNINKGWSNKDRGGLLSIELIAWDGCQTNENKGRVFLGWFFGQIPISISRKKQPFFTTLYLYYFLKKRLSLSRSPTISHDTPEPSYVQMKLTRMS